jgi:ABC-2 type transport system ATP-binding protein
MAYKKDDDSIIIADVKDLSKTYEVSIKKTLFGQEKKDKVKALNSISFSIKKGQFMGLVGPNGSGKTTLMKILAGVLVPDNGYVNVLGYKPWERKEDYLKSISVMFGNRSGLLFDLPVIDSFELNKVIYELDNNFYKKRLEKISKLLGLNEILNIPVRKLSFGQRIRAEIGLIFLHEPKFIIMDEPTIGLDIIVKNKIYEFLKTATIEDKTTVLFSTHIIRDIEKLCDSMIILNKGNIVWQGNIKKIPEVFAKTKQIVFEVEKEKADKKDFIKEYKPTIEDNKYSLIIKAGKEEKVLKDIEKTFVIRSLEIKSPNLEDILSSIYNKGSL